MGWSIGYDDNWKRWIGYGVPAFCDHPDCNKEIDRGLGYVCGGEPYGGEYGCGLYFCDEHMYWHYDKEEELNVDLCERCCENSKGDIYRKPFIAKLDHPQWVNHMLLDESWKQWRIENLFRYR